MCAWWPIFLKKDRAISTCPREGKHLQAIYPQPPPSSRPQLFFGHWWMRSCWLACFVVTMLARRVGATLATTRRSLGGGSAFAHIQAPPRTAHFSTSFAAPRAPSQLLRKNLGGKHRGAFQQARRLATPSSAGGASEEHNPEAVKTALGDILARIDQAVAARPADTCDSPATALVAVSKTKPVILLEAAYECGQRIFGENYAQELLEKAPQMPGDIRWHFIGHLQSNKAKKLVSAVPNLAVVETVDSLKLAKKLDAGVVDSGVEGRVLDVYLQINTSGESSKSGLAWPGEEPLKLAAAVAAECPSLRVAGVMTIGAPGDLTCFDQLVACRVTVAEQLGVPSRSLALSMGMSGDFEPAIARGATSVRVGSSIFGARAYAASKPPKLTPQELSTSSAAQNTSNMTAASATKPEGKNARKIVHDPTMPKFIYHVVEKALWENTKSSKATYLPPTYEQDGFIHATHEAALLVPILNSYYTAVQDDFICLELDTEILESPVKMETAVPVGENNGAGEELPEGEKIPLFPHIYGPISPVSCVTREIPVQRASDGKFLGIMGL